MISSIIIVELFQSKSGSWDGKHLDRDQELVSQCILQLQGYKACGWMSQLPIQGEVGSWKPLWWQGGHQSLSKDITRLFPDKETVSFGTGLGWSVHGDKTGSWTRFSNSGKRTRGEDVKMWGCEISRCEDEKMWRGQEEKMWRCEDVKSADVKMRRCEEERMRRCEDVRMWNQQMWRWEDVKRTGGEDVKMWGCEISRCNNEKMWRGEDEKMWRCEDVKSADVKMRRCEEDRGRRCEDVRMWNQQM